MSQVLLDEGEGLTSCHVSTTKRRGVLKDSTWTHVTPGCHCYRGFPLACDGSKALWRSRLAVIIQLMASEHSGSVTPLRAPALGTAAFRY